MISYLSGKIVFKNDKEITLLTSGGVGYKLFVSPDVLTAVQVGQEAGFECYLSVKEEVLDLYGFANNRERELFKLFISVSGVGPKTALRFFELGSAEEISLGISRGDVSYLTKVSGIGRKIAERIVVELQSKVKKDITDAGGVPVGDALSEILDALVALGYSTLEAREVVKQLDPKGKKSEQLLREALQMIK